MVNKVYLMGGVADKGQLEKIILESPNPLSVVNFYSDNDSTLRYLLRLCKPYTTPVGLSPLKQIKGHFI